MRTVQSPSLWLAAIPFAVMVLILAPLSPASAEKTALIVSTASINGETISCGCTKRDLGGIARRATVIQEARDQSPTTLVVDAGDFGSTVDYEPWMRTEFQWKMMGKLNYDVVTPGPFEMIRGIKPLTDMMATAPHIQVVSANVTDKSGNALWPPYAIVEKGGITYGVTGVTDASYYAFNLSRGKAEADEFEFLDIKESLNRVLPELNEKSDIVVVLLHTGAGDAKRVVESMEGLDVVVVGNNPGYKFIPETLGESLVVRAGNRGQYVSVLELILNDENDIIDHIGEARPLGEGVEVDQVYKPIVSQFNRDYDKKKKDSGFKEETRQITPN